MKTLLVNGLKAKQLIFIVMYIMYKLMLIHLIKTFPFFMFCLHYRFHDNLNLLIKHFIDNYPIKRNAYIY